MTTPVPVPDAIARVLFPVSRLLAPLLASTPSVLACRAAPRTAQSITSACAIYVTWDVRCHCRYVGSVCRRNPTAIADRLAEHYRLADGANRRATWALLTVLPLQPGTPRETVRCAEGWAARILGPLDGSAHPRTDLAHPPAPSTPPAS